MGKDATKRTWAKLRQFPENRLERRTSGGRGVRRGNGADYGMYCLLGCNAAHSGGSLLKFEHFAA